MIDNYDWIWKGEWGKKVIMKEQLRRLSDSYKNLQWSLVV